MAVPSWGSGEVSRGKTACLSSCSDGKGVVQQQQNVRQNREERKALTPPGTQNIGAFPSRCLHRNRRANVSSKCLKDKEDGHKDKDGSGGWAI